MGSTGVIVDMEERPTPLGLKCWVRARFGDVLTPWIEAWQLERVSELWRVIPEWTPPPG